MISMGLVSSTFFSLTLGGACLPSIRNASVAFAATSGSEQADTKLPDRKAKHSIPLSKQYVPVFKDGKMVGEKTSYFGDVHIGGHDEVYTVVFDTGSGHVILPSADCTSNACNKHHRYSRNSSSTAAAIRNHGAVRNGARVVVSFGTGKVVGEFVNDVVCLGPALSGCARVNLVTAVDMSPEPFELFDFDGVFGLGLGALTLNLDFHFIGHIELDMPEVLPQFAFYLTRTENGSTITFGGHEEDKILSPLRWVPAARPELGYWQVQLKSVRMGSKTLDYCNDGSCHAILDTGSSMLGVPASEVTTMHRHLARALPKELVDLQDSQIDCRSVPSLPLIFDLGGFELTLDATDLSRPQPWNISLTDPASGAKSVRRYCRHLLLPTSMKPPIGPKVFVLGEPVLRRYYSVYDVAQLQIGFAPAKHEQETSTEGRATS